MRGRAGHAGLHVGVRRRRLVSGSPSAPAALALASLQHRDKVLGSYLLTRDQHKQECLLHFMHDQPAGEHVQTEEVAAASSGSAFQDDAFGGSGGGGGPAAQSKQQKA